MATGPEGVLGDILKAVSEQGTYEVDSSILLYGVFDSEDELKEWAEGNALRYELDDLPGAPAHATKMVTFFRRS
jgi:hypothetical protein